MNKQHFFLPSQYIVTFPANSPSNSNNIYLALSFCVLCVCVFLSSNFWSHNRIKEGGLMGKQICSQNTAPSSVAMHKNSKAVSKVKSKIRIIHIFAPEIIKTDAANFREVVQRLTGKPTTDEQNCNARNQKMEEVSGGFDDGFRERIKGEEEIWRDANTGGGFLGGFSEFDQFPFVEAGTTHDMDIPCLYMNTHPHTSC